MITDLLTIAEAQIAEKQFKEIQAVKERIAKDVVTIEDCMYLYSKKGIQTIIEDGKVAGFCEEWAGNKAPSDYS